MTDRQAGFEKLYALIESHSRFVLTTHMSPDGDGIGCEVALALFLRRHNKSVEILNCDATPANYEFLGKFHPIQQFDAAQHSDIVRHADVIIVVDTNQLQRLRAVGDVIEQSAAVKVCIDHHLEPGAFADVYLIDEDASAAGEIVYQFFTYRDKNRLDRETAIALYTAIMTDTGSFRYPKTDADVHSIIAVLIDAGADPSAIYDEVYERGTANRLHLLGMALAQMQVVLNGKLAYLTLTKEMFETTGTTEADTDAFVPYTMGIEGVQIGIMFSELDGFIKVNFRSKGNIPVNELAKQFGGNGHTNAAGARVQNARMDETIHEVLEKAEVLFSQDNYHPSQKKKMPI
jgi:phosphoesterase RecJ-like protein